MEIYLVGGAVRDALLGREVKDRDWVVVGADAAAMQAHGFRAVGRDFPVFLHPETHEEYALARTERKTGRGYTAFSVYAGSDVSLEQDLLRRDLTVNAMAQDGQGRIIDPFGGRADLQAGILRHVSAAFAEDPVRILRTARFAARYGFEVAEETVALMRQMVAEGEADALVAERVWQEWAKGLMEAQPERMVAVLRDCAALNVLLPEAAAADAERMAQLLRMAAAADGTLPQRYAVLLYACAADAETAAEVGRRWRVPAACNDLAVLLCRYADVLNVLPENAAAAWQVLKACDALRRPQRFQAALTVCGWLADTHTDKAWALWLAAAQAVDAAAVAATAAPREVAAAVDAARLAALADAYADGVAAVQS